jgi:hypothetical protein
MIDERVTAILAERQLAAGGDERGDSAREHDTFHEFLLNTQERSSNDYTNGAVQICSPGNR